jgi:hypothetical protein
MLKWEKINKVKMKKKKNKKKMKGLRKEMKRIIASFPFTFNLMMSVLKNIYGFKY